MRAKRLPKKRYVIDKSTLPIPVCGREENPEHLAFIRKLPCAVTGRTLKVEAAHIRHGLAGGAGRKPDDKFTVPLSQAQHRIQHGLNMSEVSYWKAYGGIKEAKKLAGDLYAVTGDTKQAKLILAKFRIEHVLNSTILAAG